MTELAVIELGSNVNPDRHFPEAVRAITALGEIRSTSRVYETEPFGPPGQPRFINAALLLETELDAPDLRQALRQIEADLGRKRSGDRFAPRVIDLDICLFGQQQIQQGKLQIPDPDILERPYLARTIAEVAPDLVHPTEGQPMSQIADRMDPDRSLKERPELTGAIKEHAQPE